MTASHDTTSSQSEQVSSIDTVVGLEGLRSLFPEAAGVPGDGGSPAAIAATPHSLIRGVTDEFRAQEWGVSCSLDWVSYTVAWPRECLTAAGELDKSRPHQIYALRAAVGAAPEFRFDSLMDFSPRGYNVAYKLSYGSLAFHSTSVRQKIRLELTGSELGRLLSDGYSHSELLQRAFKLSANFKRLDFALDIFADVDPLDLLRSWEAGQLVTPAHEVTDVVRRRKGANKAATVYFGAPSSARRVRVYDKAAEQGVDFPWVRVELVCRDEQAAVMAAAMIADGIEAAGRAALREFIKTDVEWFNRAATGNAVYLAPVRRKQSDTDTWLLEQVIPSLRERLRIATQAGDWLLYDAFQRVLDEALKGYRLSPVSG